jgi:hypothetical protein
MAMASSCMPAARAPARSLPSPTRVEHRASNFWPAIDQSQCRLLFTCLRIASHEITRYTCFIEYTMTYLVPSQVDIRARLYRGTRHIPAASYWTYIITVQLILTYTFAQTTTYLTIYTYKHHRAAILSASLHLITQLSLSPQAMLLLLQ